jgi:DNA-binding XRE family transcriptional regulator
MQQMDIKEFDKEECGRRMKQLRLKYQMTQDQVAQKLGKTRAAYGGCENGSFRPGMEIMIGIRQLYLEKGEKILSMDWLFCYTDNPAGILLKQDDSKQLKEMKAENSLLKSTAETLRARLADKEEIIELLKRK